MKTLTKESQVKRILTQRQNKKPCTRRQNERVCLKAEQWQHSVGLGFKRQWNVRCYPGISVHLPPQPHIPCVERGMASSTERETLLLLLRKPDWSRVCSTHSRTRSPCPPEPLWVLSHVFTKLCSGKFASNGNRLKENFIFELILGSKMGTVFERFNAINSKFWRMSPPEWQWGF